MAKAQVRLHGLKQLDRALGKADKNLRSDLRQRLKGIADIVAVEAKSIASRVVEQRTGDLIRGIKPFALSGKAGVRSNATHGGYAYPRRLEFEGRSGRPYGPRASLSPAVDARLDDVARATEQLLDDLADDFHEGL